MSNPLVGVEFGALAPQPLSFSPDWSPPPSRWSELTPIPAGSPLIRLRARDLGEARRKFRRITSSDPRAVVLLDVYAYTAATWSVAFRRYMLVNPLWRPGGVFDTVTFVGAHGGLTGLIGDIVAGGVAHGVTVQGPDEWLYGYCRDHLAPWVRGHAQGAHAEPWEDVVADGARLVRQ